MQRSSLACRNASASQRWDYAVEGARTISISAAASGSSATLRGIVAVSDPVRVKACSRCGEPVGRDRWGLCRDCDNARKRDHRRGALSAHDLPDREPCVRLRQSLERSRAAGLAWDAAWRRAVGDGLREIPDQRDRADWRQVFAWSMRTWRAAYLNEPWDTCRAPFLAD